MILSSADLKRILGGNQIIRLSATVEIVEGKPAFSGREGLFIYIKRYPELGERRTWRREGCRGGGGTRCTDRGTVCAETSVRNALVIILAPYGVPF